MIIARAAARHPEPVRLSGDPAAALLARCPAFLHFASPTPPAGTGSIAGNHTQAALRCLPGQRGDLQRRCATAARGAAGGRQARRHLNSRGMGPARIPHTGRRHRRGRQHRREPARKHVRLLHFARSRGHLITEPRKGNTGTESRERRPPRSALIRTVPSGSSRSYRTATRDCRRIVDHALRSGSEPEARTTLVERKRWTRLVVGTSRAFRTPARQQARTGTWKGL